MDMVFKEEFSKILTKPSTFSKSILSPLLLLK